MDLSIYLGRDYNLICLCESPKILWFVRLFKEPVLIAGVM
jgi:hypothetical protein